MTNHNIGFIKLNQRTKRYIASCGCGTIGLLGKYKAFSHTCEKCGNTNFASIDNNKYRVIFPHIEVIESNRKGFKVKRTNVSVFYDDDFNVFNKSNMVKILILDFVNDIVKIYKNGVDLKVRAINYELEIGRFLTGVDHLSFKNQISTDETKHLYDFTWSSLSKSSNWGTRKFSIGLVKLFNYKHMQILNNAGYTSLNRFYETRGYYYGSSYTYTLNSNGTTPKDIFELPKFILQYIKDDESLNISSIKSIKSALKKVDANRFREILEIVKDESYVIELVKCVDIFVEIHDKFNYNNLKRLALYLFREVRMNQGIASPLEGCRLLRDYINMSTDMGQEYDKYPKSLKKEHDITSMNYKVKKDAKKMEEFSNEVTSNDYNSYEWKKRDFSIITPKEMDDLIKEGSDLSHCVASYVNSIIEKRCKIFFLRKTEDLETSLATVEVRGNNVRQARGYSNRSLTSKEKTFIAEWADKKNLRLNYY